MLGDALAGLVKEKLGNIRVRDAQGRRADAVCQTDPLIPTSATVCPGLTTKDSLRNTATVARVGYRNATSLNSILP